MLGSWWMFFKGQLPARATFKPFYINQIHLIQNKIQLILGLFCYTRKYDSAEILPGHQATVQHYQTGFQSGKSTPYSI
jgi:hypothetical protein